jgi:hypothetical protein
MPHVDCIAGSPFLAQEYSPLLHQVISALAGTGVGVAVTCAAGAPAQALVRAAGLGCLAAVFAVGDADGSGFWGGCGPFCNLQSFARGRVHWLAGGPIGSPLPLRLKQRAAACLRYCAQSAPGARIIVFLDRPDCNESLAVCHLAASLGLDVVAFPCGFEPTKLPELAPGGHWVPSGPALWSYAGLWVPPKKTPTAGMPELPSMEADGAGE